MPRVTSKSKTPNSKRALIVWWKCVLWEKRTWPFCRCIYRRGRSGLLLKRKRRGIMSKEKEKISKWMTSIQRLTKMITTQSEKP